jgi:hypothetical protein
VISWQSPTLRLRPRRRPTTKSRCRTCSFLNNTIHDILYRHGFDEAAGNFQVDNFGKGGVGDDPVRAEAQDGGGTDNANFATPPDGSRPRMQVYLWTGAGGTHEVVVNSPVSAITGVRRGIRCAHRQDRNHRDVVVAEPADGCTRYAPRWRADCADRPGTCEFGLKVLNAQKRGAIAAIVANNQGGTGDHRDGPGRSWDRGHISA